MEALVYTFINWYIICFLLLCFSMKLQKLLDRKFSKFTKLILINHRLLQKDLLNFSNLERAIDS
jgi:hypothetical protein